MNNDLISRSELKKALTSTPYNDYDDLIRTENLIDNAPTVEPEKAKEGELVKAYTKGFDAGVETARPQGEWIDEGQYAEGHSEHAYFCKNCNYEIIEKPNTISENRFCKNCGADMQKGGAE